MRIVICEFMDGAAVESLATRFDVTYDPGLVGRRGALRLALADADGLIVRNRTQVDAELLASAPVLSVVGRLGVGLDNIAVDICAARAIEVIPALGANALAVGEYVLGTAMLLLRSAYRATEEVAAGQWPRDRLGDGREIGGKTLGLIGFGEIGRVTAKLARALGMRVIAFDSQIPESASVWKDEEVAPHALDYVMANADVVSLHVPLNQGTRNLVNAERLAKMKHDAVIINTARGGILDEAAVAAALIAGTLGGAALDVFDDEPLPPGSTLAGCPNLILTPHIAGVTRESNVRVSMLIADKVAAHLAAR